MAGYLRGLSIVHMHVVTSNPILNTVSYWCNFVFL